MADIWQDSGVVAPSRAENDLKIHSSGEAGIIHVWPGRAHIAGHHYYLDSATTLPVAANTSGAPRTDLVVLRLDRAANSISLAVRQGTPGNPPAKPQPDRGWNSPEIVLGYATVPNGTNSVPAGSVEDARDLIGQRIRVGETPTDFPPGALVYKPSTQSWHGSRSATAVKLATESEGDVRWAARSHSHGAPFSWGGLTMLRSFDMGTNFWMRNGPVVTVALGAGFLGTGTPVPADTVLASIPAAIRPFWSVPAAGYLRSYSSGESHGAALAEVTSDGYVKFVDASTQFGSWRYLWFSCTYVIVA
ncbi:hypothetical protein SAMN05421505_112115 [Sinosporangium album]|uniref:Minor tail protein n=1 Tax=Sinosporangium album TaxID=504805 RepID=A0A1G8ADV9_9ACTN|nr:hypothetical protein SAMN05421505_112115 [Sinosporangium album]